MDKQLQEYILDWIELDAYRSLEGVPFDFGTGLIENELSYGTEEAIWEMEQQQLEEIIDFWEVEKTWSRWLKSKNRKKKHKLNHYKKNHIDKIKLKKLYDYVYTVYFNEAEQRYKRFYLSGCRKYAKWCTNRKVRNADDFPLKGGGYRKTFNYWWVVF